MGKGKRYTNNKKSKKNILRIIFIILFIISIIYIISYFWNSKKEQKETDNLLNTVDVNGIDESGLQNEKEERIAKVKELKNTYSETVGWIEIEGTNVNYPVMHRVGDNDFYMDHDYKGEKSTRGSIFLDKDYDWSIPSSNLLLYGHNNKDGSMFADLLKYKEENFYKEHPTIRFTTPEEDAKYEIISVFLSRIYYKSEKNVYRWYYFLNAENEKEYNEYINNTKQMALYDTGKTAEYGQQLLTLVTCEYSYDDGRLAVVARKIEE